MVGRTPEYLGKKIQAPEMKLVTLYILAMPIALLVFAAASVMLKSAATYQPGPHGLSEVLYNFASAANNNGSAFAYQGTGTQWYTVTQGIAMLIGRFFLIIPALAVGGSLAAKPKVPATSGTLPTHTPLFGVLVAGVDRHRRRPDLLPGARAGPDPRTPLVVRRRTMTATLQHPADQAPRPPKVRSKAPGSKSIFDPGDRQDGDRRRHQEAEPADDDAQPGDVHRRGRLGADHIPVHPRLLEQHRQPELVRRTGRGVAVVHRVLRQLRRGDGRGPRQGPGGALCARRAPTRSPRIRMPDGSTTQKSSSALLVGDLCVVVAGEVIPGDGEIVEGIATVDESAITGESAPVIRESGGDRSAVTGGTRVLSDEIVVRITAKPGETFLDRMIALVEGANRQKTPNEIALSILLAGLDHHLPARGRDAAAVRHLLRRRAEHHRAGRAARLSDPDHDRRPAVGDRHRRDGSTRSAQRAGDVGTCRRGSGGLHDAAARQDGNDHLRITAGI